MASLPAQRRDSLSSGRSSRALTLPRAEAASGVIASELSVGLFGRVSLGRLTRAPSDGEQHILWIIPELALSATYHGEVAGHLCADRAAAHPAIAIASSVHIARK
jgi:hypothetical protein